MHSHHGGANNVTGDTNGGSALTMGNIGLAR